jgi:GRIP domain
LRRELARSGVEVESCRQELQREVELKVSFCYFSMINLFSCDIICLCNYGPQKNLETRVEELMAFLDRSKKFQVGASDPDAAINMEYLKNCVYRYMATTEHSERKRLAPVICTILKLTSQERRNIQTALSANEVEEVEAALSSLGAMATSSFQSIFGFGTTTSPNGNGDLMPQDASVPVPALGLRRGQRS